MYICCDRLQLTSVDMEQCSTAGVQDDPGRGRMGFLRRVLGATLVLAVPTTILMTVAWACQLQWLRRLWGAPNATERKRVRQCVTKELTVPQDVVGYVIGRHGARVRQMEEDTGARIRFKDMQASKDKVASITGGEASVESAVEMLTKVIEERVKAQEEREKVSISVPSSAVGRIIGRQGANIRTLQRESGATITVPSGGDAGGEKECVVTGTREQITQAVALLQETVQQSALARKRQILRRREEIRDRHRPPQLSYSSLPSSGQYFGGFVSSVDSDGSVWVQVVEGHDPTLLDNLVTEMTEDYSKLPEDLAVSNVAVGMTVASPFEGDMNWYRAMVTKLDQGGHAELLYLDFGDRAEVELSQLRNLRSAAFQDHLSKYLCVHRPEYYDLPVQAICCQIAGIQPKGGQWTEEATDELARLTLCALWRVVMIRVSTQELGKMPTVNIVDTTTNKDIDVAEQLVELGLAEWGMIGCDERVQVEWEGEADTVGLAGTFSQWRPIPMKKMSPGKFEVCLLLSRDEEYQCKFLVDRQWKHSSSMPSVCDGFGGQNNVIVVQSHTV